MILKPQLLPKKQLRGYITPFFALYYVLKKKMLFFVKLFCSLYLIMQLFIVEKGFLVALITSLAIHPSN